MKLNITSPTTSTGVVQIAGSLTVKSIDVFRSTIATWLEENEDTHTIVLDCEELDMLDSSGLGGILAVYKELKTRNGDLKVASLPRKARMVFEITKAHTIFNIFDTPEDALATCA